MRVPGEIRVDHVGDSRWEARSDEQLVGAIAAVVVEENTVALREMYVAGGRTDCVEIVNAVVDAAIEWSRRGGYRTVVLITADPPTVEQQLFVDLGFASVTTPDFDNMPSAIADDATGARLHRRDLPGVVALRPYNPAWPGLYERERERLLSVLDPSNIAVHHTGSTSVPGIAAKPIIDITMTVPDSTREATYVSPLATIGYSLTIREPHWHEHRLLNRDWPRVNLHVFSHGCVEVDRMVAFRDWLRTNDADRELYASTKARLAARDWDIVQDYADAKSEVVADIMSRALPASI